MVYNSLVILRSLVIKQGQYYQWRAEGFNAREGCREGGGVMRFVF